MTATATTPAAAPRRALIVIDVQNEYFTGGLPIEYPPVAVSLPNVVAAMDAATAAGIPMIVVQNDSPADASLFAIGSHGWQLHADVAARKVDLLLHKTLPSVFAENPLRQWLQERDIDTLAVVGYMTHNCDASTIFDAAHFGLAVEFLQDATGSLPYANTAGSATAEEIHRVFSTVFHSRFAAVTATAAWIAALQSGLPIARSNIAASNQQARALTA